MSTAPILRVRGYFIEATHRHRGVTRSFLCGHRKESYGRLRGHWLGAWSEPVLFSSSTKANYVIKKVCEYNRRTYTNKGRDMSYRVIPAVIEVRLGIPSGPGRVPDEPSVRADYKQVRPRKPRRKKLRACYT